MTKFWAAEDAQEILDNLLETCDEFDHLRGLSIKALFRDKHTKSGGKIISGKCVKQPDLQRLLHGIDFIVMLANDIWIHLEDKQKNALVYHELCHATTEVDTETGEVTPSTVGHDCETFYAELQKFGAWHPDLDKLVNTVKQLDLFKDQNVTQLRKPGKAENE